MKRLNAGENKMNTNSFKIFLVVVLTLILSSCANSPFYHEHIMRGQIVGFDTSEIVVCIGTKDGAEIGQQLEVYRTTWDDTTDEGYEYDINYVGKVEIVSVVNEHFARAKVINGDLMKHDIVEFTD